MSTANFKEFETEFYISHKQGLFTETFPIYVYEVQFDPVKSSLQDIELAYELAADDLNYLCTDFNSNTKQTSFELTFCSGYYADYQLTVKQVVTGTDNQYLSDNKAVYKDWKTFLKEIKKAVKHWPIVRLIPIARFSNGEVMYTSADPPYKR